MPHGKESARQDSAAYDSRLRFETLLSELSARFVNLPPDQVDQAIEHCLEQISRFLGAARGGLHQFSPDGRTLSLTHAYVAPGITPLPGMTTSDAYPWSTEQIRRGRVIHYRRVPEDIPPEAQSEKRFFDESGSRSFLAVPLKVGDVIMGGLAFGAYHRHPPWTAEVINRLKLMGEVFANALTRKQIEERLSESEERFKKAFEHAAVGMSIFDPQGRFMEVNGIFADFLGYTRRELLGRSVIEVTFEEDREISRKRIAQALRGDIGFFWLEKRYRHRDGQPVWGHVSSALIRGGDCRPLYFVSHIQDITEKKKMGEVLKETNTAMKVILNTVERDKERLGEEFLASLENLVFPYLEKLGNTPLDPEQRTFVELIQSNLSEIAGPFTRRFSALRHKLTPTEMTVADLIRQGKTSKEIAVLLKMSVPAVFFHRNNIRRKLGIRKTGINLSTYLRSRS